ncbi:MAG: chromosome segregation protein SMC [Candidatus Edwardsbacteria bacterium]|nr:chromosome segregation protein SMC [Candidatus Edwardsbacteria bacterium]
MYLSRLELFGFKSFPQKITLEIGSGITCIVGPNGCGKTNVIDAIRWCLGEQSTKMLRSDKMEDVIFSGARDEKPLSMAEVSLIFSNQDGQLPVEYSEVSVTRRLFRSGESEYLMNNQVCRLKDIVDLFLNTGLGADSYSLIESKMIDTILSEDPSIRRSLFEEAAGVAKYRLQKRTAQRRMEATTEDLLRLQDIVSEVEKRLRSLKRQASKARVYDKFNQELRDIDLKVAAIDRDRLNVQALELKENISQWQDARSELSAKLEMQEGEISSAREALEVNEGQIEILQQELSRLSEQLQLWENNQAVIKERRSGIEQSMERREKEIKLLMASIGEHEGQIKRVQESLQRSSGDIVAKTEQLKIKESALAGLESELTSAKLALSEARKELFESLKQEADGKEQLALLENRYGNTVAEQDKAQKEGQSLRRELEEGNLKLAELNDRMDSQKKALQVLTEEKIRLKQKSGDWQKQLLIANDRLRELSSSLSGLQKEKELLSELQQKYEGYGQGAQHLLSRRQDFTGTIAPLAEMIEAEPGYQAAIEAALAEKLQWLAVEDLDNTKKAIALLKSEKTGKAALIALSAPVENTAGREISGPGIRGSAFKFVRCDQKIQNIVNILLKDVIIVESLDNFWEYSSKYPGVRLVSLDGEVLHSTGAIEAGELPQGQIGLLQRKERIEKLGAEISSFEEKIKQEVGGIQSLKAKLEEQDKQLENVDRETEKYQKEITTSEGSLAKSKSSLEMNHRRLNELEQRSQALQGSLSLLESELNQARGSFQEISESNKDESGLLGQRDQDMSQKEEKRNQAAEEVNRLRIELSQAQSERERLRQESANMEQRKNEALERIQNFRAEDQAGYAAIAKLQEEAEKLSIEIEGSAAHRKTFLAQREEMQRQSQGSLNRLKQAESVMHRSRLESDELQSKLSQAQIELGSVRNDLDNITNRLRSEYEVDIQDLAASQETNLEESRSRIEDLRHRLKKLGPVNFAAFQELQQDEERYDFLVKQRDDLLSAKEDLANTIRKIDETARAMFLETFEAIKKGFSQIFQRLFIGGEADLKLTGSDDPLEAEIEILATPEGKSMKSIRLLSGGEKAMTATALLFGIYLVKPAPFCVLDELDAPLDDANVQRFCAMLKDFASGTQFLVITHNKRTMEVADRLYGVTMEKPGISKVVSVKFDNN